MFGLSKVAARAARALGLAPRPRVARTRVLLAVGGGPSSAGAAQVLPRLGSAPHDVTVLHVQRPGAPLSWDPVARPLHDLEGDGARVRGRTLVAPGWALPLAAESRGFDVAVLGLPAGPSPLASAPLASFVSRSACPVVLVRPAQKPAHRGRRALVLCATTEPLRARALEEALAIARLGSEAQDALFVPADLDLAGTSAWMAKRCIRLALERGDYGLLVVAVAPARSGLVRGLESLVYRTPCAIACVLAGTENVRWPAEPPSRDMRGAHGGEGWRSVPQERSDAWPVVRGSGAVRASAAAVPAAKAPARARSTRRRPAVSLARSASHA